MIALLRRLGFQIPAEAVSAHVITGVCTMPGGDEGMCKVVEKQAESRNNLST